MMFDPVFDKFRGRTPGYLHGELYRRYAVLAPFLPETGEFLFQVRAQCLHRQPGEICFPGGRIEEGESPLEAALRETREELLVSRDQIEVIAPLDILANAYQNVVYPYLANLRDYDGRFQAGEVGEVFTVPFDFFLSTEPEIYHNQVTVSPAPDFPYHLLGRDSYPWGGASYPVLFYRYGERVIWGMTALFVRNIVLLYRNKY